MAHRIAFVIQVLQQEPADPNTWDLNVGDDVTGAYPLNVRRAVEGLPLSKEVTSLAQVTARQPAAVTSKAG
jgi:hypothetical protein